MASQQTIRQRRRTCWWEPTYDPTLVGVMVPGNWNFANNKGPTKCHFDGSGLAAALKTGLERVIRSVTFTDCDFQGFFQHNAQLVFDECQFINCDLGLTTWENVKFSQCKFEKVSFGQTKFENCEFRSCSWKEIGLSPNAFELEGTYFSNCSTFISAAVTNLDAEVLRNNNADPVKQKLRLEVTKATVARRILKMMQLEGDELAFYDAVKTFQLQHAKSRQSSSLQDLYNKNNGKIKRLRAAISSISWVIEYHILNGIGYINDWGASVTNPIILAIMNFSLFSVIYNYACTPSKVTSSWQRSYDISILAGYTNYGSESDITTLIVQNIHILASIVIYSVTFATIINRLSRVR